MSQPPTGTVGALLHEVANRDLYQRNAFHVTDLPASVHRRVARHRQQQFAATLQVGADLKTTGSQDPDELRAAFDRILGDPRRRLVDEVFGRWDAPDDDCGCEAQLHHLHDLAVRTHAAGIAQVAELRQRVTKGDSALATSTWHTAGGCWQQLLEGTGFWQHLRNRVLVLDDWQLAATAIDQLRAGLPATLTGPLVDLTANADNPSLHLRLLRAWPFTAPSADQVLTPVVRPQYERMEAATQRLARRLNDPATKVDAVVAELETSVLPTYRRLQVLLPSDQHPRTLGLRDDIGRVYNNAAIEVLNRHSARDLRIVPLLEQAEAYAAGPDLLETITANQHDIKNRATYRSKYRPAKTPHQPPAFRDPDLVVGCGSLVVLLLVAYFIYALVQVLK